MSKKPLKSLSNSSKSDSLKEPNTKEELDKLKNDMIGLQNRYEAILKTVIKNAEILTEIKLWKQQQEKTEHKKEEVDKLDYNKDRIPIDTGKQTRVPKIRVQRHKN